MHDTRLNMARVLEQSIGGAIPGETALRQHTVVRSILGPLLGLCLLGGGLGGCDLPEFMSHPVQVRGNRVDPEVAVQLVPGTSTRADALALLGSPTTRAAFDDNTWIYASELTKPVIAGTQAVEDQRVYVLTFDEKGVLKDIRRKSQADAPNVQMVDRATPSPGNDVSALQLLLGNIGRFGAGGTTSSAAGGTGTGGNY